MAKFCGNCGAASDDNANVCGNCGAPFAAASKGGANDILAKIPGVNNMKPEQKDQVMKIAKIAVPAIAAVVVVLILIFGIIVPNTGARGAVKKYFKAIQKTDVDAYIDLMPESRLQYYKDDEDTSIEDEVEEMLKESLDYYEDEYGKNVKFKIKITEVDDMSNKKLKEIKENYKEDEELDGVDIEEGKEVDFDITIKGKDDDDDGDGTMYLIKEDGKWKMYSLDMDI